jgi:glutamine cyclotransferase
MSRDPCRPRSAALLAMAGFWLCASGCAAKPASEKAQVVNAFPHDPEAFTQGLLWHDGHLYESTGLEGSSSICKVELETGKVLQRKGLNKKYFGEGLALLQGRLYQLTWQNRLLFVYDLATFEKTSEHPLDGDGWGLTTDGRELIWSDGTATLRWIEPGEFRVTRSVEVKSAGKPLHLLNELEWIEGEIWANRLGEDHIARIDPVTGKVKALVDCSHLLPRAERRDLRADVLNGIAYDPLRRRIFVTGKRWPRLFEITAVPAP